jgi:nucleotide-sensitive chloride channel 1A
VEDFTPLSEYQSQTPETFHGGKAVLHYHATGVKAWIPKSQQGSLPFFPADAGSAPTGPEAAELNGDAEEQVEQLVDLFVNSELVPSSKHHTSWPTL